MAAGGWWKLAGPILTEVSMLRFAIAALAALPAVAAAQDYCAFVATARDLR